MNRAFFSASHAPTRLQIGMWASCVIAMVVLALRDWNNYSIGMFYDDAIYALLPRSLLQHARYGLFFVPPDFQRAAVPFGFPLLLTPLVALFPTQVTWLRFIPLAASVVSMSLLFWGWTRLTRNFSYAWGAALVAVLAFSPLTILFARILFSEAVFLMWLLITLLLVERMVTKTRRWDAFAFGAAAMALVYTRTIGWLIVATLVLYVLYRLRRAAWRPLVTATLGAGIILTLIVSLTPVEPYDLLPTEYLEILAGTNRQPAAIQNSNPPPSSPAAPTALPPLFQRALGIGRNIMLHLDATDWLPQQIQIIVLQFMRTTRLEPLKYVPSFALLALMLWGAWRWLRQSGVTAFAVIVPLYLAVLMIWPWQGTRMFYPVQAQLVFALLMGLYGILEWFARFLPRELAPRAVRAISVVGIAVIMVASVAVNAISNVWFVARTNRDVYSDWILTHTPTQAVILTSEPATDYLHAPRLYVQSLRGVYSARDLMDYLGAYNITYVIAPASDNPRADLVAARTGPMMRYNQIAQELATHKILLPRYTNNDADITIFQVDTAQLAAQAK